jgi:hypothetical protein
MYLLGISRILFPQISIVVISMVFIMTAITCIYMFKHQLVWIFMILLIITMYYNPLILLNQQFQPSVYVEILIALILFLISLFWEKILEVHLLK